jgi:N-carbamoylputrescine amidase
MSCILKTGVAQFASAIGEVDANIETHMRWIAEGRKAGLDLLVMPEVSLTGHFGVERLLDCAIRRTDPRLLCLAEAAGDMAVVIGFIEEGQAAQFYNTAAILRRGHLAYLHRKVNLPSYGRLEESKHYAAGRFVDICKLDDNWTAGL